MTRDETRLRREIVETAPALRRFAYSLARDAADADDLVQSTIERVLAKGAPPDVEILKWMYRICRNLWIDAARARKVRSDAEPSLAALSSGPAPTDQAVGNKMLLEKTAKAIDALPGVYREVLAMVVLGGASYQETADAFDLPVGTVMSRLARARAAIAEEVNYRDGS